MGRWRELAFDLVWPHLSGPPEEEPGRSADIDISDHVVLSTVEDAMERRLGQADERFRIIEAKLVPLLALVSLTSAVLSASVPLTLTGKFNDVSAGEFIPIVVILLYISTQMVCSLLATVDGLTRRGYATLSARDLDPLASETAHSYRLRLLNGKRANLWQNEWATNQKASQLALAHAALRNALFGVAALIICAITIVGVRNWG